MALDEETGVTLTLDDDEIVDVDLDYDKFVGDETGITIETPGGADAELREAFPAHIIDFVKHLRARSD